MGCILCISSYNNESRQEGPQICKIPEVTSHSPSDETRKETSKFFLLNYSRETSELNKE